jgi:hypothetical protein
MTHDEFYQSTLPPLLGRVESVLQAQLLPKFDLNKAVRRRRYAKFNLDEKLRGSFEDRAAIMATTTGGPIVTVNESRTRLDLPPIPGFDKLYVPLNSVLGQGPQASPQNPVDTPAPGINPAGTTPGGGTQRPSAPAKDAEDVLRQFNEQRDYQLSLRKAQERYARALRNHFTRQKASGKEPDTKRWDRELTEDLFGVAIQVAEGMVDHTVHPKIEKNAKFINSETAALLATGDDFEPKAFSDERIDMIALILAEGGEVT